MNTMSDKKALADILAMQQKNPQGLIDAYEDLLHQLEHASLRPQLNLACARSLYLVGKYEETKTLAFNNLNDAIKASDWDSVVHHYLLLAQCFYHTKEEYRIKACFELAMDYGRKAQNQDLLATVFMDYGAYLSSCKSYEAALQQLETARKTILSSQNTGLKIKILLALGNLHYMKTSYNQALSSITKAYELSLSSEDYALRIRILDLLATLYDLSGKTKLANEMLNKALHLCSKVPAMRP